ncbi:MAG TPA: HAD hydrolase-like protein [Candidatus Saccharimonadales bacterium]|nr:HAD hydrolase-like protein [Candidatus Saccharimonadales bacterium]
MPKPTNKPIIAVDVDDVLAAENEGIRQFINQTYGHSYTAQDFLVEGEYNGYWEHLWQLDKEEALKRFDAFLNSSIKDNLKVVEGAIEAIEKLKRRYELIVVTSRYGRQLTTTEPWLEGHFPKTFSQVAFVATWSKDKKVSKAVVSKEIGADYLIDDNFEHCELAAKEGITALLFGDYGWNRSKKLPVGVIRAKNWQEVLEYFENEKG